MDSWNKTPPVVRILVNAAVPPNELVDREETKVLTFTQDGLLEALLKQPDLGMNTERNFIVRNIGW